MSHTYRPSDAVRCTFTYRDGCRMLRADHNQLGFCPYHIERWLNQNDIEPPRRSSLYIPGAFDNPWAVRRSLKQVAREVADGRVTPAQAKQLVRLGRLLLVSTRRKPKRRTTKAAAPAA